MTYRLPDELRNELKQCFPDGYKLELKTRLDTKRLKAGEIVEGSTVLDAEDQITGLEEIISHRAKEIKQASIDKAGDREHRMALKKWLKRVKDLATNLKHDLSSDQPLQGCKSEPINGLGNLEVIDFYAHQQCLKEYRQQLKKQKKQHNQQEYDLFCQDVRQKTEAVFTLRATLRDLTHLVDSCMTKSAYKSDLKHFRELMADLRWELEDGTQDRTKNEATTLHIWLMVQGDQANDQDEDRTLHDDRACAMETIYGLPAVLDSLTDLITLCMKYLTAGGIPDFRRATLWTAENICHWMMQTLPAKNKPATTRNSLFERLIVAALEAAGVKVAYSNLYLNGLQQYRLASGGKVPANYSKTKHGERVKVQYCEKAHQLVEAAMSMRPTSSE